MTPLQLSILQVIYLLIIRPTSISLRDEVHGGNLELADQHATMGGHFICNDAYDESLCRIPLAESKTRHARGDHRFDRELRRDSP